LRSCIVWMLNRPFTGESPSKDFKKAGRIETVSTWNGTFPSLPF
jgi:hypothetical protein